MRVHHQVSCAVVYYKHIVLFCCSVVFFILEKVIALFLSSFVINFIVHSIPAFFACFFIIIF